MFINKEKLFGLIQEEVIKFLFEEKPFKIEPWMSPDIPDWEAKKMGAPGLQDLDKQTSQDRIKYEKIPDYQSREETSVDPCGGANSRFCEDGVPITWDPSAPDWQKNLAKAEYWNEYPDRRSDYVASDPTAGEEYPEKLRLPPEARKDYPLALPTKEEEEEQEFQKFLNKEPDIRGGYDEFGAVLDRDGQPVEPYEHLDFPEHEIVGDPDPPPRSRRGVAGINWDLVVTLSEETGVNPAIIGAYQMVESGRNPIAFAFNQDNYIRSLIKGHTGSMQDLKRKLQSVHNVETLARGFRSSQWRQVWTPRIERLAQEHDRPGTPLRRKEIIKRKIKNMVKTKDTALYGGNVGQPDRRQAWKFFKVASEIDPLAAIKAGAWGSYQVLGGHLLKHIDTINRERGIRSMTPQEKFTAAVDFFKSNPRGAAQRMFINWVKAAGQRWVNKTNNLNFSHSVRSYYGGAKPSYVSKLGRYYNQARRYLLQRGLMPQQYAEVGEYRRTPGAVPVRPPHGDR